MTSSTCTAAASPLRRLLLGPAVLAGLLLAGGGVAGAETCPNAAVRAEQGVSEGSAHALPDCRGYELASPVLKNEEEVNVPDRFVAEVSFQAAEEGGGVAYSLTGAIPGSESGGLYGHALSTSPAPGSAWSATPLEPSNAFGGLHNPSGQNAGEFEQFSNNLSCGVMRTRLALPAFDGGETPQLAVEGGQVVEEPEEGIDNLYLWRSPGEFTLITNVRPAHPNRSPTGPQIHVDGASSDCSHVLFEADNEGYELPVENASGERTYAPLSSLYEWTPGASTEACRANFETCRPRVASVLPDGTFANNVVDPHSGEQLSDLHEMSGDGRRIFFSAISDGKGPEEAPDNGAQQIYLRESGKTVAISLSQTHEPVRDAGAKFELASSDGSRAFFAANYGLTGADGSSPTCHFVSVNPQKDENNGAGTGCDLYEYDSETGALKDLSADTTDPNGADVRGVLGASEDGSMIYFSATGQLVPGEGNTAIENEATSGTRRSGGAKTEAEANVYVYSGGTLRYVTTIGEAEAGGWNLGQNPFLEVDALTSQKGMHYYNARVTADGHFLLFATRLQTTAYDNAQQETGTPEWEDYEYSLDSGSVSCVSCNPTGEKPVADPNEQFSALGTFDVVQDGAIRRNLTEDGHVFFNSFQPLQSAVGGMSFAASNHSVNVYEWTPEGLDGCQPPAVGEGGVQTHGCLAMLSSGTDPFPSYFEGASADASSAYIITHAALVAQDVDGLNDVYDVRVDGGIPTPPPTPSCSAEMQSCQPAGAGLSSSGHASESGAGGGNVVAPPAPPTGPTGGVGTQGVKAFVKRKVKGTSVTISVVAPAQGKISVGGSGLKSVAMSASKAGVYKLKVSLMPSAKKTLRHKHKLKLKLRVSFVPVTGNTTVTTASLTFV